MDKFLTVVKKVVGKVKVSTIFTPDQTAQVGADVLRSIDDRLARALDIYDQPAPALKDGYSKRKQRKTGKTIRDLLYSGRLRRNMKVLLAKSESVRIGFTDDQYPAYRTYTKTLDFYGNERRVKVYHRGLTVHDVLRINQRRSRQWGISPTDRVVLANSIRRLVNEKTLVAKLSKAG